jgi:outer membrane protein insertion porin family
MSVRHLTLIALAGGAVTLVGPASLALAQAPASPTPAPPPPPAPTGAPGEVSNLSPALEPFENRVIREVKLRGLKNTGEQLVRNQIRSAVGRPLKQETVQQDIQQVTRLGRFSNITALIQPFDDQTVTLVFEFEESPIIKDVQVVGNRELSDQDLSEAVTLLAGTPVDRFQLDRALRQIEDLYRKKGFYQAQVTIDQEELDKQGIVLFRIREGQRVKVTSIRFEGNATVPEGLIRPNIKTEEAFLFLTPGTLDDNQLDQDVAAIIKFYKDRGYLDVRADRQIRPSPNGAEAIVTFLIEEGPRYTLRSIRVESPGRERGTSDTPKVLSPDQIKALVPIKPGDVYSLDKLTKSLEAVRDAYGQMGYADTVVNRAELRDTEKPLVDLLLVVQEGGFSKTGTVTIRGNDLTQDKVIRREVQFKPDRPLDATEVKKTEQRLREVNLFAAERENKPGPRVTIQAPDPENPLYRDVLVEVEEKNTGSLSFGAAVSSDSGVIGQINLNQRNFDLFDTPDSIGELFSGRAFRGAGQNFSIAVQPGSETQNYAISLTDPAFLESDYSVGGSGYYRTRDFDEYNERRLGGQAFLGRAFGRIWTGSLGLRVEQIDVSGLNALSPLEIKATEGENLVTALGVKVSRSTIDSRFRPTSGTRLDLGVERVGAMGGSYSFTKLTAEHRLYLPLFEDYLGRKTIFSLRTSANWIPEGTDEAPPFERFFLGGRDFRGFNYRGVSPRGPVPLGPPALPGTIGTSEDPVGGAWSFFIGPQIEQPIIQKVIAIVGFIDSGTVTRSAGFHDYRVSGGVGLRLYIPQLGPFPIAFDFGFPIKKVRGDAERVFSFSLDLPF